MLGVRIGPRKAAQEMQDDDDDDHFLRMEEVTELRRCTEGDDGDDAHPRKSPVGAFGGRTTSVLWSPECIPEEDVSFGGGGMTMNDDDDENDDGVRCDSQLGVRYDSQLGVRYASQLGRANDPHFCRFFCCANGCAKNIFEGFFAVRTAVLKTFLKAY